MGIFVVDQNANNQSQTQSQDNGTTEPVLDATTPSSEVPQIEAEIAQQEGLDRSVFNCPDCSGEGLKSETELCPKCNGTGKVNQ